MGYQTNLVYWLANVVGNVGLAVAGLGYLTTFFPSLKDPLIMAFAQIAVIWFFTYANILGPKVVGRIQSATTSLALNKNLPWTQSLCVPCVPSFNNERTCLSFFVFQSVGTLVFCIFLPLLFSLIYLAVTQHPVLCFYKPCQTL